MSASDGTGVRSLWWSADTGGGPEKAPFGTAHLKVYYPARAEGTDAERLSGELGSAAPSPTPSTSPSASASPAPSASTTASAG